MGIFNFKSKSDKVEPLEFTRDGVLVRRLKFKLINNVTTVYLEILDYGLGKRFTNIGRFRPEKILPSAIKAIEPENQTVANLGFQIEKINQCGVYDSKSLFFALKESCIKHINQHGRLIDIDLYAHIDATMHIIESTKNHSLEEYHKIYYNFLYVINKEFEEYIYISTPSRELIKLTDSRK